MKYLSNGVISFTVSILMAGTCAWQAPAQGKLDAFEADVIAGENHHHSYRNQSDSFFSALAEEVLSGFLELTLLYGGACSWERIADTGIHSDGVAPRAPGEPLIPFARVDIDYQNVSSVVDAMNVQADLGYGPAGAHLGFTRYREQTPTDHLDLIRALATYRMSFGSHVETDLGFGILTLNGEQTTSEFLFCLPVLIHPGRHWGIEFRPSWADRIRDYDLALLLTQDYVSFKLGYRWVDSRHESLDGPYAGISLRL